MIVEVVCVNNCDGKKEVNLDTSPSGGGRLGVMGREESSAGGWVEL
jgi:hypothetical protein